MRPTRRRVLAGIGACSVSSLAPLRETQANLRKTIPATGETISAIGMGSWLTCDLGDVEALRRQRTEVLRTFFELGGELIDSSPMYGSSQAVIGDAPTRIGRPAQTFAADKVWIRHAGPAQAQIAETSRSWGV